MTADGVMVSKAEGATIVSLVGHFDLRSCGSLDKTLTGLMESGERRIIVDMEHVIALDSSIIGLLFGTESRIRTRGGRLLICGVPRALQDTFDVLRVDQFISMFKDRAAALGSCPSPLGGAVGTSS